MPLTLRPALLDSVMNRFADKLPGRNLILALADSPNFFSLVEFVECYFDPYHVEVDSERSWPMERLVRY